MFPNAKKCISKIFVSEILFLIATICASLASVNITLAISNSGANVVVGLVLLLASLVLVIIAGIMQIVGLTNGSKDSSMFRYALFFVIFSLVLAAISAFFKQYDERSMLAFGFVPNYILVSVSDALNKILDLIVMFFVIGGIRELITDKELLKTTKKIAILACIAILISLVLNLIVQFSATIVTVMSVVLSLGAMVCSIIFYIMYLVVLAKAKKIL